MSAIIMKCGDGIAIIGGNKVSDVYMMIRRRYKRLSKYCVTLIRDLN